MTQIVVFADPIAAALRVARAATVPELAGASYGTKEPAELKDAFPGLPYGMFRLVSSDDSGHPFRERATLQITVWAATEAKSLRFLQVLRGVLTAYDGDAEVGSISAGIGPLSTFDGDNGYPMSSAGIRIRLRPTVI